MLSGNSLEPDLLALLMLLTFPFLTFYGYRLFHASIAAIGLFFGGYTAYILLTTFAYFSPTMEYILTFSSAVLGALIFLSAVEFGVFMIGAVAGGLVSNLAYQLLRQYVDVAPAHEVWIRLAVSLVCCFTVGMLCLYCLPYLLRVLTSLIGGYLGAASLSHYGYHFRFFPSSPLEPQQFFNDPSQFECSGSQQLILICSGLIGVWLVLFVLGVAVQSRSLYKGNKRANGYVQVQRRAEEEEARYGLLTEERRGRSYMSV